VIRVGDVVGDVVGLTQAGHLTLSCTSTLERSDGSEGSEGSSALQRLGI